ncbi:MAG TPA: phage holin family protein [Allosphingosinicella sp.]|nr:phage holin family protein [Allosphingosinicella sp.]
MDARVQSPTDSSIGELFGQLVDDGRTLVRSEVGLYKQIALYRAGKAKNGAIALVAGGLLAYAGLIAALVGLVIGLTDLVGGVAAGLIVLAVTGLIAFLLVRYGAGKMAALSGDEEEKAALAAGERRA